jgi:hypothetical protein
MGGDCSTDSNPPSTKTVAAPGGLTLKVDAVPGGNSYALISWTASPDENNNDFKGYRVITVELNSSNQIVSVFNEQAVPRTTRTYTIFSIGWNIRYKSFVVAELNDGTKSDSIATKVYAGVYFNNNGSIDSYTQSGQGQSGYGWNVNTGQGSQYPFVTNNAGVIDLHVRETTGTLFFYSPNGFGSQYKNTRMRLIGSGQAAFDETELQEPDETFLPVNDENVYLLRTQENYYIKIWVKSIQQIGNPPYFNISFDYKVQPVEGLRLVKR